MKTLQYTFVFSFIVTALSGCNPNINLVTNTSTANLTEISPTASSTLSPTAISITPTNTPEPPLYFECPNINVGYNLSTKESILALEPESWLLKVLPDGSLSTPPKSGRNAIDNYSVSPDYKKLAYFENYFYSSDEPNLVILESGNDPVVLSSNGKWIGLAGWLDDETILLEKNVRNEDGYIKNPVPLIALNYKTRVSYELDPNFPGIYSLYPDISEWNNFAFSEVKYSPLLEFAIYPKMSPYDALVLWDVKANQQVAILTGFDYYGVEPKWAPDGESFLVAKYPGYSTKFLPEFKTKQELFRITKSGEVEQLTDFANLYSEVKIGQFSWSPDGNQIAFWLLIPSISYPDSALIPSDKLPRLAILDLNTRKVTSYCIAGGWYETTNLNYPYFNFIDAPVWSPDGTKLAVQFANENGGAVVVVDIAGNSAYQIIDSGFPIGWLTIE